MKKPTPYERLTTPYRRAAAVAYGVMHDGRDADHADQEYRAKCKWIADWIDHTFDSPHAQDAAVAGAGDYLDSEFTAIER